MRRIILFILIIITLSTIVSASRWMYSSQYVLADVDVSSNVQLKKTSTDYKIEYVTANLTLFPDNLETQQLLKLDYDPKPISTDPNYIFRWEPPIPSNFKFKIESRLRVKNTFIPIKKKVNFPITETLPKDIHVYTQPSKNIDSTDQAIINRASLLAAGETDMYIVVYNIADWVKQNIQYDLSTLTAKVSQSASWTLQNKAGVCDELTSLFIGMLRSLGIPARFISGVAYTNSPQFPTNWGAHGWAEVYFPGIGWVPFDVTYGEFGFVDPTHIILKTSIDSDESAARYKWRGRNVELNTGNLNIEADLADTVGHVGDFVSVSVDVLQDQIGIGSYNVVEGKITNLKDSYIALSVAMANVNGMSFQGKNSKNIMLKPRESKKIYWIIRISPTMDPNYVYTFPASVYSVRNTTGTDYYKVSDTATIFSLAEMQMYVNEKTIETKKTYSKKVDISCDSDETIYYTYDLPKITCKVKNTGNSLIRKANVCLKDNCSKEDFGIGQEKSFSYTLKSANAGINKIPVTVKGTQLSNSYFYDLEILDEPSIQIDDLSAPEVLRFGTPYILNFILAKDSVSQPLDVEMHMDVAGYRREIDVGELTNNKKMILNMNSADLTAKPNNILITVLYKDKNGRLYNTTAATTINLIDVNPLQHVEIAFRSLDKWLRQLFD